MKHIPHERIVHFHEFVSCLTVPKCAAHGPLNKQNIMKDTADSGVNSTGNTAPNPSSPTPNNVPNVLTTVSLASKPVTNATAACQNPNPNGANIGAIILPNIPRTLSIDASSTPGGKLLKIHTSTQTPKIMVPAFLMKREPLSHMCNRELLSVGILYGGSSMINGAESSLNTVDLSTFETMIEIIIPTMYNPNVTILCCIGSAKNTDVNNAYIGILALQEMKGNASIVEILSLSFANVLVAITPVTLQPIPNINGINALPDNPMNLYINLSITNAALAKYPQSSIKLSKKNNMNMIGTNVNTEPTPPITPLTSNEEIKPSPKTPNNQSPNNPNR